MVDLLVVFGFQQIAAIISPQLELCYIMNLDSNSNEEASANRRSVESAKKKYSKRALIISLITCGTFILTSGWLVIGLKDADRAEERYALLSEGLKELETSIETASKEEAEKLERLAFTRTEASRIEERYQSIKEQFEKAEEVLSVRNQASQEFSDLSERIVAAEKTISELIEERNELISANQDLLRKKTSEQGLITEITERKLVLTNSVRELEDKKNKHNELAVEEEKLNAKIAGLTEKSAQLNSQVEIELGRLLQFREQIQSTRSDLTSLEAAIRSKTLELEDLNKKTILLTADYTFLTKEITAGRKELAEVESTRREVSDLKEIKTTLTEEIAGARRTLSSIEISKLDKQTELLELSSKVESILVRERALAVKEAKILARESAATIQEEASLKEKQTENSEDSIK